MIRRETAFKLVAVAGSLLAGLLFCELALRILVGAPPEWRYPQEKYLFDPLAGHRLEPGQSAYTHGEPVTTNSMGYRDAEYPTRPDDGTVRVIGLGDSQTFGNGIPLDATWPKQLLAALERADPETAYEVINAGVPATNTWQHEVMLSRLLDQYHPDAVVLGFFVNDVDRGHVPVPPPADSENALMARAFIVKRSAVVSGIQRAWGALAQFSRPSRAHIGDENVVTGNPDPLVDLGWQRVETALAAMKAECDARGVVFMLSVLPRRDQISGRMPARGYNERIAAICARLGIPAVDTLDALQAGFERHGRRKMFVQWDGHHTRVANEIIAGTIVDTLLRLLEARGATITDHEVKVAPS